MGPARRPAPLGSHVVEREPRLTAGSAPAAFADASVAYALTAPVTVLAVVVLPAALVAVTRTSSTELTSALVAL